MAQPPTGAPGPFAAVPGFIGGIRRKLLTRRPVPSSPLSANVPQQRFPPQSDNSPPLPPIELSEGRTTSPTNPPMSELGRGSRYETMAAYEIDGGQVYEASAYRDSGVGAGHSGP